MKRTRACELERPLNFASNTSESADRAILCNNMNGLSNTLSSLPTALIVYFYRGGYDQTNFTQKGGRVSKIPLFAKLSPLSCPLEPRNQRAIHLNPIKLEFCTWRLHAGKTRIGSPNLIFFQPGKRKNRLFSKLSESFARLGFEKPIPRSRLTAIEASGPCTDTSATQRHATHPGKGEGSNRSNNAPAPSSNIRKGRRPTPLHRLRSPEKTDPGRDYLGDKGRRRLAYVEQRLNFLNPASASQRLATNRSTRLF